MILTPIQINYLSGKAELYIIADSRGMKWGYVVNVEVPEQDRRKGIGIKLMGEVEKVAKLNGCKFVKLTTRFSNLEARLFYQKLNYWESVGFGKDL